MSKTFVGLFEMATTGAITALPINCDGHDLAELEGRRMAHQQTSLSRCVSVLDEDNCYNLIHDIQSALNDAAEGNQ